MIEILAAELFLLMYRVLPVSSRNALLPAVADTSAGDVARHWFSVLWKISARLAVLALLICGSAAEAWVSIEPVHGWVDQGISPEAGLVQGSDGYFYGTTSYGGVNGEGTIFRVSAAGEYEVIHAFSGADKSGEPYWPGLVQGGDGYIYGMTLGGGTNGRGSVYRVNAAGEYAVVYSFTDEDGRAPSAALMQGTDGYFYGATSYGGASGGGTIFRVNAAGAHEVLHSFPGRSSRLFRGTLVQGHDGYFYGTSSYEGVNGKGMIFRISAAGEYAELHSFDGTDGSYPRGGLVLGRDGYFYGTTSTGGAGDYGTVFRISVAGELEVLHSFSGADGGYPGAQLLRGTDGNFYGTTSGGGDKQGTIYRITVAGEFEVLHSFTGIYGAVPDSGLVQGYDGHIYGTTSYDGPSGNGTVFRISTAGEYALIHAFGYPAGYSPGAGLVQGSDGRFYGATSSGGPGGRGTIYRMSVTGEHEVVHNFSGTDGGDPGAGLVQGSDGDFYGTTTSGGVDVKAPAGNDGVGSGGAGTIFQISAAGEHKVLHYFAGTDGSKPFAGLVQGTDGYFYGATAYGGPNWGGAIFRINSTGEYEVLHYFTGTDGKNPRAALVQSVDGYFYGTTASGGANGKGTVFRISAAGEHKVLHHFSGTDSYYPSAALVQGADGSFYGTTVYGGANGYGTVFRISAAGAHEVLHSFSYGDGSYPYAGLLQGGDGYFYGTASSGGYYYKGVLFRISAKGEYTMLYSFDGKDGQNPWSTLVAGSDGKFWGTTIRDTVYGGGMVYRIQFTPDTLPAERVTYSSAILRARVSRSGGTAVQFEYGTSPKMPIEHTDFITLQEGTNLVMVSAELSNLEPGTTYYYRVGVRRADGSIQYGELDFFTTSLAEPQTTVLASKGAAVPGAGNPSSGIPSGATWKNFGVPTLGGGFSLAVAFGAGLNLTDGTTFTGIFVGASDAPALVLKQGEPAAGLPQGSTFSSFKDPLLNSLGQIALVATVSTGGKKMQGIWSNIGVSSGRPEWLVASQGAEAANISSGARWKAFTSVTLSDSGVIIFTATLEQGRGGVTSANDSGLWQASTSGTSLLLREGQELVLDGSTRRVKSFVALTAGQGRFKADGKLPVKVTFSDKSQALLQLGAGAEPEVIAASGDAVVDTGGALFRSFGLPALNQAGTAVFSATLLRGIADVNASNDSGIFMTREDNWGVIVRKGDIAPGVTWKGAPGKFVSFGDPLINAEGQVAFMGNTTGGAKGIWWSSGAGDDMQLVASTVTAVPGVEAARFAAFKSVALPDGTLIGPVFVARLEGKGITPANDVGLWAVDRKGLLRLIVREGDMVDGKVLRSFTFLSAVPRSSAQPRGYDAQRQLIYRAFYTDGSQSLVSVSLP